VLDWTLPHMEFRAARGRGPRRVVAHLGPTNSGKTYNAIKALGTASSGAYCGPLRLLAWEVHERLLADGVKCSLLTGQECEEVADATHVSSTIEMAHLSRHVDIAVIDEIQLLADDQRGWAWTRAFLGIPAAELHVCGDPSSEPLLRDLCRLTGDELVCKRYERLAPLEIGPSVKSFAAVEPGDCVVAFGRRALYKLKREIEGHSGRRCCIVYGGLPPEARREQARLFNTPGNGYDVLVASDAVGMGLNLNVRRVVFSALKKFDGRNMRYLTPREARQIAGRAGRYGGEYGEGGVVAVMGGGRGGKSRPGEGTQALRKLLDEEPGDLTSAGLHPTAEQLEEFAANDVFGQWDGKFSELLEHFCNSVQTDEDGLFYVCDSNEMIEVARSMDHLTLSVEDRFALCVAPTDMNDDFVSGNHVKFAKRFASGRNVALPDELIPPRHLKPPRTPAALARLESVYKSVDLYSWLAGRMEGFDELELAQTVSKRVARAIDDGLLMMDATEEGDGGGGGGSGSGGRSRRLRRKPPKAGKARRRRRKKKRQL